MSTTGLTNIQEVIERSLFETIRLELVDKGYLPDITLYADTPAGHELYDTAINTIVETLGFAIEIFSTGTNKAKMIKKIPRIVIKAGSFLPGSLGGSPSKYYSDQGTYYKAMVTPPQTVDFYIDYHLVSETIAQERVLSSILALAIPRRAYITRYDDSTKTFFSRYLNYYNIDEADEGISEKVYKYEIPDCWDTEDREVEDNVAKLNEVTLHTNIQKYMDGSWGYDTDDLVVT